MKYYFTFGYDHKFRNRYYVVEGKSYGDARKEMMSIFGKRWAFQYEEKQWVDANGQTQAEEYNLKEIK